MALAIHISSYISGGYTSPVIWRLYEAGSGVFVDDHQEVGPHGVVYNFSFINNIRDIVYRISLYEQPGGTGVGTLIKSHDITVSTSTLTFDSDIETIVDGGEDEDPVAGEDISPIIDALVGKDFYVVQRGIGQLRAVRDVEIINNGDGSYSLTGGNTFNPGDTFIIKIRPQFVVNPAGTYSGGDIYKSAVLITSDTTLSSTDFGKKLIVDGSLPVVTLQFPAIADIMEKLPLYVESIGTTHINVVLKMALGETIKATATTSNTFILGRAAKAEIIKVGSTLYGFTSDMDVKKRGQFEWGFYVGLNRLWADGTEYLTADYPGLKQAMDAMPAGAVVSYTLWNSSTTVDGETIFHYRGKYALSDDTLHFRVPDFRNRMVRGLRYSDATSDSERLVQGAGGFQNENIKAHNHTIATSNSDRSDDDNADPVRSGLGGTVNTRGGEGDSNTIGEFGGLETVPSNNGMIPLVII